MNLRHLLIALLLPLGLAGTAQAREAPLDPSSRAQAQERLRTRLDDQLRRRGLALPPRPEQRRQALSAGRPGVDAAVQAQRPPARALGLIVRWRADVGASEARMPDGAALRQLSEAAGQPLQFRRTMGGGYQVLRFDKPLALADALAAADRVAALPGIDAAEPDAQVRPALTSGDPYFVRQWNLLSRDEGSPGGIGATGLWNYVTGSPASVVAVIDSGVLPHPDFADRLLPGYDFVSNLVDANDGNGRDSNATDPGDWTTANLCEPGDPAADSSWHGTHVAGIVAADGGNGIGVAGVDWRARILPVRVLGRCGGSVSDIVDAIRWSAGLPVPGVPNNPNPAQVINLSLGGFSARGCQRSYQEAINAAMGQGSLLVVAAGNSAQAYESYTPANCQGVLTVVAVDPMGDLASYSNYSFEGKIAAPGGDMSRYGSSGGIWSTVSGGRTTHTTFGWAPKHGTSMAAPHIAGMASLALAINPNLIGVELGAIIQVAAAPFPDGSDCTTYGVCGEGVGDALMTAAVAAVMADYQMVYEFYNEDLNHYFRTGARAEAALVNRGAAGAGWFDTVDFFYGWSGPIGGARPVCRFYGTPGRGPNSHFYTVSQAECDLVKRDPGWTYEGTAFYAKEAGPGGTCSPDDAPVYRVYNGRWRENDSNHRFTTDREVYDRMVGLGWIAEGVVMCAAF